MVGRGREFCRYQIYRSRLLFDRSRESVRRANFRARIKTLSGQTEGDTRLDCNAATWPRNSRANTGTIPRFTVTAGTVSGQRAARVCNQRTHFNAVYPLPRFLDCKCQILDVD